MFEWVFADGIENDAVEMEFVAQLKLSDGVLLNIQNEKILQGGDIDFWKCGILVFIFSMGNSGIWWQTVLNLFISTESVC